MAMELGMTIPTQQVLEAMLQEPERAQLRGALRGCMSCCIWAAESCFSLRSVRLALIDLPDFFAEWVSCGDLSAMAVLPRRGAGSAPWRTLRPSGLRREPVPADAGGSARARLRASWDGSTSPSARPGRLWSCARRASP